MKGLRKQNGASRAADSTLFYVRISAQRCGIER